MNKTVLIQRFYANFREGLFDKLNDDLNFSLISHHKSYGKIKTPKLIRQKPYFKKVVSIRLCRDYVFFPFLILDLISINPKIIVTEGGKNTLNNIQIFIYCLLFNKSYIVWDLGKAYKKDQKAPWYKAFYFIFQNYFCSKSKRIFTYNKEGQEYFANKYPEKDIIILKNTVDTNRIKNLSSIKAKFPQDVPKSFLKKRLVIGYIGALNKAKKTEMLQVLETVNDVALIVVGDGNKDYVALLNKKLKNIESVFVGYKPLDELNDYYSIIDVIVMPGLGGLTIPQSYAFGTSVIAVKADGTEKEIIENEKNGYVLDRIEDLPNILNIHTKHDFKLMGEYGKSKIYENFSIDNYSDRFKANL